VTSRRFAAAAQEAPVVRPATAAPAVQGAPAVRQAAVRALRDARAAPAAEPSEQQV